MVYPVVQSETEEEQNEANKLEMNIHKFESSIEVPGDKTTYTFSKLPEVIGSGQAYLIRITAAVLTVKENEVFSPETSEKFITKPLPPTNLRVGGEGGLEILWHKSITPNVIGYKVRWKPLIGSEDVKAEEASVDPRQSLAKGDSNNISFNFPSALVQIKSAYKVNVYAIAESDGLSSESKELHEKFYFMSNTEMSIYSEDQQDQK